MNTPRITLQPLCWSPAPALLTSPLAVALCALCALLTFLCVPSSVVPTTHRLHPEHTSTFHLASYHRSLISPLSPQFSEVPTRPVLEKAMTAFSSIVVPVEAGICGPAGNDSFVVPFVIGGIYDVTSARMGWDTAIHAVNTYGGINGCNVSLRVVLDTGYLPTVDKYAATRAVLSDPAVVAFAPPSVFSMEAVLQLTAIAQVPVMGPFALQGVPFTPLMAHVIHVRSEFSTEVTHQINYGVNGEPRCNRFSIVFVNIFGVNETAANARQVMLGIGLPDPLVVELPTGQQNYQQQSDAFAAAIHSLPAGEHIPDCYMLLVEIPVIRSAILNVTSNATLYDPERTSFFSTSFMQLPQWLDNAGSAVPFKRLFTTKPTPQEQNTEYDIVDKYHGDTAAFIAANPTPGYVVPNPTTTLYGFDAYIVARLLFEAMSRVPPRQLTGPKLIEAIYRTRVFALDDFVLGPYSKGCTGKMTNATGPCFCNSGGRKMFMVGVNASTGRSVPIEDDPAQFESGIAEVDIPIEECSLTASFLQPSVHVVTAMHTAAPAASRAAQLLLSDALRLELLRLRQVLMKARSASVTLTAPVVLNATAALTQERATALQKRYRVSVMAASSVSDAVASAQRASLTLAPMRYTWAEEQPAVVPFAAWSPWHVPFWPAIADMAHTAVSHLHASGRLGQAVLVADSARLAQLLTASAHTFGVETAVVWAVPTSVLASRAAAAAWLRAVFPGAGGALVVASQAAFVVQAAQGVAADAVAVPVVLATSELLLADNTLGAVPANVQFVSGLERYATGAVATSYGQALAQVSTAFTALGANATLRLAQLYSTRFLVTSRVTLGPFSDVPCPAAGICQAAQGITRLYVRGLATASNPSSASVFQHQEATGRVAYKPLPASSTNVLLIAVVCGVAGALLLAFAAVAVVYVVCIREPGRDNGNAPKDAGRPFAMVFTDIQASTTLWAQAPQQMGPALDEHHALMRRLVRKHKGYEVKTIGDSFMVAFEGAERAMLFALAVQEQLHGTAWGTELFDLTYKEVTYDLVPSLPADVYHELWNGIRVRVGVHYGMGDIKFDETSKGYDYYGTVVNTAARVEGVGHGGQVLLTKPAMEAVTGDFARPLDATTAAVADLGPQPLRGLEEPVHLYQLLPPRFHARTFPPLRLDVEIEVDAGDDAMESGVFAEFTALDHSGKMSLPSQLASGVGGGSVAGSSMAHSSAYAASIACRGAGSKVSPGRLLYAYRVVQAMLSTSPAKFRQQTIRSLAEKWRVAKNPPPALARLQKSGMAPEDVMLLRLAMQAVSTVPYDASMADADNMVHTISSRKFPQGSCASSMNPRMTPGHPSAILASVGSPAPISSHIIPIPSHGTPLDYMT